MADNYERQLILTLITGDHENRWWWWERKYDLKVIFMSILNATKKEEKKIGS